MKVIVTFIFCCDNQWESVENSGNFFSYFVATLLGHLSSYVILHCSVAVWLSGNIVGRINEVALR